MQENRHDGSRNRHLTIRPARTIFRRVEHGMRIGQTILTFLVALSLAMVPVAGAFAVHKDLVTASNEEAVAPSHDCCDDEGMPADHGMKCQASAGCAAKCFNFYAVEFSGAALPFLIGGTKPHLVNDQIHSRTLSPPFRPPRV